MAQDPFGFGNLDDIFRAMQGGNVSRPEDMYGQQVPLLKQAAAVEITPTAVTEALF